MSQGEEKPPRETLPARLTAMTFGRMRRLILKELREILRDRRTIVTLLLMPLLVYPMLSFAFQQFLFSNLTSTADLNIVAGVPSNKHGNMLREIEQYGSKLLSAQGGEISDPAASTEATPQRSTIAIPRKTELTIKVFQVTELENALRQGLVDVLVRIAPHRVSGDISESVPAFQYQLRFREGSPTSSSAVEYIKDRIDAVNDSRLRSRLHTRDLSDVLPPRARISSVLGDSGAAFSLATVIPLILILMTVTGAVYPAIDLTAGERERGTLETLIAAPVPRVSILLAKYCAVLTVAMLTGTINLLAMTMTVFSGGLGPLLFGPNGISWLVIAEVFGLLLLFATFFSAVLLVITSMARSFKEAQAYLIPVMLIAMAPGILSIMPGLEFTWLLSCTPLVNIVLLGRDLFNGSADPVLGVTAVLSTVVYTGITIALAARVFGADAILYGSQGTWKDLFRRPTQRNAEISLAQALGVLVVSYPVYFVLGGFVKHLTGGPIAQQLIFGMVATIFIFGGLPFLAARFLRVKFRSALHVQRPPWLSLGAAILLGLSLWPFAHELVLLGQGDNLQQMLASKQKLIEQLLEEWRQLSPVFILTAYALVPAIFEELFFRGFLLPPLTRRFRPWLAISLSAVIFGLFHIVQEGTLIRFLPSTFLGLALGWTLYRTQSVLPGIVLHTCNNSLLLMVAYYRPTLSKYGWGIREATHLPMTWILVATAATLVGLLVLYLSTLKVVRKRAPSRSGST